MIDIDETRTAFEAAIASDAHEFGDFFLFRLLGLSIRYETGVAILTGPVRTLMLNPQGAVHGGIIATILDTASGHLLRHDNDGPSVTLEQKVQYIGALRAGGIHCEARYLKKGRSISFVEARMQDGEGRLVATATSTWKRV